MHTEIARINELRAMADMLQKQLEGSMHGPSSSSALGPRPSPGSNSGGGRDGNGGGGVVLVSNLNEKVFVNYCIYVFHFYNYTVCMRIRTHEIFHYLVFFSIYCIS